MDINKKENIINLLNDLKNNHAIVGIKSEFEDEGSSFEEVESLKEICDNLNLPLTLKIGGCGALNDLAQAKRLGIKTIVAPMIESKYAVKKFIEASNSLLDKKETELYINIETISAYNLFDTISNCTEFEEIKGIIVGRFDMAKSIGLECKDTNGNELFKIVNDLSIKTQKIGKIFTTGGGISDKSITFLKQLPYLQKFETRKVIFDADFSLKNDDIIGINKAIQFEMLWLESKYSKSQNLTDKDLKRLSILKKRFSNFELV